MNNQDMAAVVEASDKKVFGKMRDLETSTTFLIERSEKRAWYVAVVAIVIAFACVAAISIVVMRHKPYAFLTVVDKVTGETSTIKQLDDDTLEYRVVDDKHNVKRYVESCESYIYTILQRDYDLCLMLSNNTVGQEYAKRFEGKDAWDKVLNTTVEYRIKVLSVRLPNDEPGKAVVSYEKTIRRIGLDNTEPPLRYVATLSYKYIPSLMAKESVWIENPRGFKVTAFRADPELIGSNRPAAAAAPTFSPQPSAPLETVPAASTETWPVVPAIAAPTPAAVK